MAVQGDLQEMELTTLISVNCNEGNQAKLVLENGEQEACIYFDRGNIAHMVKGDQEGEDVIHELLEWDKGSFELEMDVPPPAHTVDTPWSHLVLSGIQRIDERAAGPDIGAEGEGTGWELDGVGEWGGDLDGDLAEETPETRLDILLREMAEDVQGFISADVVAMDGLPVASYAVDPTFDVESSTTQLAMVMKLVEKTSGQLSAGQVADNLVTTKDTYVLARFLGDGSYHLCITVDRQKGSLGNVRLIARTYSDKIWDAIPDSLSAESVAL
jgi:predicted regulator of Ras-like GTPase activity (Roadblock/LC7/MglB family)